MPRAARKCRLVVGGGRAPGFPKPRSGDVAFNFDADALPDVQGDINRAPFRAAALVEVYLERVPYDAFSGENLGAIQEIARILEVGGRLVIETGVGAPVEEVTAAMRAAGFLRVRVTKRGALRITGRRGEDP